MSKPVRTRAVKATDLKVGDVIHFRQPHWRNWEVIEAPKPFDSETISVEIVTCWQPGAGEKRVHGFHNYRILEVLTDEEVDRVRAYWEGYAD
jgi:hypothetical protein